MYLTKISIFIFGFQASTELNCCSRKDEFLSDEALIEKNAVEIVKQMQKLRGIDGEYDSETGSSSNRLAHRRTIHMLEKNRCEIFHESG